VIDICHRVEFSRQVKPDIICPTCCHWGHITYSCSNPELQRCELCVGTNLTQNHHCIVTRCSMGFGRPCMHIKIKYTNRRGKNRLCLIFADIIKKLLLYFVVAEKNRELESEVVVQADGSENIQVDDNLEDQGHTEIIEETRYLEINVHLQSTGNQKIYTDEGMDGNEDAFSQVTKEALEPAL
ncbi:hypothetical protein GcC1_021025, partial [Golovinomyces cichoracearum]